MAKRRKKPKHGGTRASKQALGSPPPSIQQTLDLAKGHHGAGRLSQAEALYLKVLRDEPDHPAALHLLGVIGHQTGKQDRAVELITKALAVNPDDPLAHYNLGLALSELGRLEDAVSSYGRALVLKPDFIEAESNRGNALQELGRLDDAVQSHQKALVLNPDYAEAHYNLGNALRQLGRLEDAAASYKKAIELKPDFAEALNNLGSVLHDREKLDEAEQCFHLSLEQNPDSTEALVNLGNTLLKLARRDEAVATYEKALSIKPDFAKAYNCLGNALKELGRMDDAVASYEKALSIDPDDAEAHINLGSVLHSLERLEEAAGSFRRALDLEPASTDTLVKLGNVLRDVGFNRLNAPEVGGDGAGPGAMEAPWDEALGCADQVLSRDPANTAALGLKSAALIGLDRHQDWERLSGFEHLMQLQTMTAPDGYADLKAFNEALLKHCFDEPTLIDQRYEQSLSGGKRVYNLHNLTRNRLFHPLLAFMDDAIERYRADHPVDSSHPFLTRSPERCEKDVWGSILEGEGYLRSHNHPEGWLSGVYYGKLPDVIETPDEGHEGWIEFGRPPNYGANPDEPDFHLLQPKEGLLVLWPSYYFHRTVPFESPGIRFSIAVDIIPLA
ncbi:MAG: tetratricopeptide repeat protein [Rhodospirillales bacterium]